MIDNKFTPNQKVQVRNDNGTWRDAIITKSKWYGRGQYMEYEYQYDPYPMTDKVTGISPSTGGWQSDRCFRLR